MAILHGTKGAMDKDIELHLGGKGHAKERKIQNIIQKTLDSVKSNAGRGVWPLAMHCLKPIFEIP